MQKRRCSSKMQEMCWKCKQITSGGRWLEVVAGCASFLQPPRHSFVLLSQAKAWQTPLALLNILVDPPIHAMDLTGESRNIANFPSEDKRDGRA